jgi:hypothetical protein
MKTRLTLMAAALFLMSSTAQAHDGHGNSIVHAVLHMAQDNGIVLGLVFLGVVLSLLYRAGSVFRGKRQRGVTLKGSSHDSR